MQSVAKMVKNVHGFLEDIEKITSSINEKEMQNLKGEGAKQYQNLLKTISNFKSEAKNFVEDDVMNDNTVKRIINEVTDKYQALKNNKPLHEFYDDSQDFFSTMKNSIVKHPLQAGLVAAVLLILIGKK